MDGVWTVHTVAMRWWPEPVHRSQMGVDVGPSSVYRFAVNPPRCCGAQPIFQLYKAGPLMPWSTLPSFPGVQLADRLAIHGACPASITLWNNLMIEGRINGRRGYKASFVAAPSSEDLFGYPLP